MMMSIKFSGQPADTFVSDSAWQKDARNLAAFANEISELGRRRGLGIAGGVVFILEIDDYAHDYVVADTDELRFA